jgi:hypothetical protein
MAANQDPTKAPMRFESLLQADVPKGRDGKHKQIIELLLNDISQLEERLGLEDSSLSPPGHEREHSFRAEPRNPAKRNRYSHLQR